MSEIALAGIGIVIIVLLMFLRMPIGLAMAVVGFIGLAYVAGMEPALTTLGSATYRTVASYSLTVIPLFVLMGQIASTTGFTEDAFDAAYKWLGHMRGGLAMGTVAASTAFGAVCGSTVATATTMCAVALPQMRKHKYTDKLSTGCIAAGGNLGFLIPPSIGFITYGVITEESIGALFIAGILPGLLLAFLFMVTIYVLCRVDPQQGPAGPRASWGERLRESGRIWSVLLLAVVVLGSIYGGWCTPTEAAGLGVFGIILISIARGRLTWQKASVAFRDTALITGALYVMLIGVFILSPFLALTGAPTQLAETISGLALSPSIILVAFLALYVALGTFMDLVPVIFLTLPIIFPTILALGFDPIWFGVLVITTHIIGNITPPFGIVVYAMSAVLRDDVPLFTIFRGALPFVGTMLVCLVILIVFPQISLLLPSLMMPYR